MKLRSPFLRSKNIFGAVCVAPAPFCETKWSRLSGSNRRPTVYKTVALPAELSRQPLLLYHNFNNC